MMVKKKNLNEIVVETREDGTVVMVDGVEIPPLADGTFLSDEQLNEAVGGKKVYFNERFSREGEEIYAGDRVIVNGQAYYTSNKGQLAMMFKDEYLSVTYVAQDYNLGSPVQIFGRLWVEGKSCTKV